MDVTVNGIAITAGIVPIFIGLGLIFKANNSTQGKDATKSDVVLKVSRVHGVVSKRV